jgi:hypothetical protein
MGIGGGGVRESARRAVRGPAKAVSNVIGGAGKLADAKYDKAIIQLLDAAGFATGVPAMNPVNDVRKLVKERE